MSGGHFDYQQYRIGDIADAIQELIDTNNDETLDEWGDTVGRGYNDVTIQHFCVAVDLLRRAQVYAHRIDWLVSGDDGEESFHERLAEEIKDELEDEEVVKESFTTEREWVGLTAKEIADIVATSPNLPCFIAMDVEAKLKEKNT
jgi:RNA-binding protein YhbY